MKPLIDGTALETATYAKLRGAINANVHGEAPELEHAIMTTRTQLRAFVACRSVSIRRQKRHVAYTACPRAIRAIASIRALPARSGELVR